MVKPLVGWIVLALTLAGAVGLVISGGGAGFGACAPPPPGWHPPIYLEPILRFVIPPAVVFFVLAYFALGIRSRFWRVVALLGTLVPVWFAAFLALLFMPFSCGTWAF